MVYKREIFDSVMKYIDTEDIIVLIGARQVGKTSIMYYMMDYLKSTWEVCHYMDLEDSRYLKIVNDWVDSFENYLIEEWKKVSWWNKLFVFLDEIQYMDNPSSFLKLIADHHKDLKLVVSWSSTFEIKSKFKDSLVWRTVTFEIFPLSFSEFLLFKWYIFPENMKISQKKTDEMVVLFKEFTLYGGYPKIVLADDVDKKETYLQQIIDTYIRKDIRDLAKITHIDKFNKLLEVLASQTWNVLNVLELANTCNLAKQTVENYLFLLENTYIIRLVRPFHKNLRSELFKSPKIYFYDSWIAQMLWLKKLQSEIIWNVFETTIFGELTKKYWKNNVFYWRTTDKREIDFILNIQNDIIPIEIKLNFSKSNISTIKYFTNKYQVEKYHILALYWQPKVNYEIYPWGM